MLRMDKDHTLVILLNKGASIFEGNEYNSFLTIHHPWVYQDKFDVPKSSDYRFFSYHVSNDKHRLPVLKTLDKPIMYIYSNDVASGKNTEYPYLSTYTYDEEKEKSYTVIYCRYSAEFDLPREEYLKLITNITTVSPGNIVLNPAKVAKAEHILREKIIGVYLDYYNPYTLAWERRKEILAPQPQCIDACTLF